MDLDTLNQRHAIADQIRFIEGPGGLPFAEIDNALGTAYLCLQGAHVTTWRPKDQDEPVIWLSDHARFAPGKSIRGGVPVCWPWFGPHASEPGFPAHGFARTLMWTVTGSEAMADGATRITLTLPDSEQTRAQWPHASRVQLTVTVGASLELALTTHNLGNAPLQLGEALHTYFQISDIGAVRVTGLDGRVHVDKVDGGARKTQTGAVTFDGEVDRVYLDTEDTCVIEDPGLGRRIVVAKRDSRATVLWTPWRDKADKMGDFGADGWRRMVCVESANALDNIVTLAPGAQHTLWVRYHAEALPVA